MTPLLLSIPRSWRALAALLVATLLAVGCGGGDSGVGAGGTGSPLSFSQGPITGFGSIIVNGVHFDDAGASVVDDDGNKLSNTQSLRLGTVVDVQGGVVTAGATAASAIRVHVDLVGPVTGAYNAGTGRLAVLGQAVRVLAATTLDGFSGGAAAVRVGGIVAVSSLYDKATGVYVATRIDPAPGAPHFAIRGAPTAVDTAARTFTIGTEVFSYGSLAPPASFAAGQSLRAVLATSVDRQGRWVVAAFGQAVAALPDGRNGAVDGVVNSATDATHFVVDDVSVDASGATVTPAGSAVAVQSRVQVQGTIVAGVLVATSVLVHASNDGQDDHGGEGGQGGGDGRFQIAGAILGLDTAHQTLTMRGPTTVSYATAAFAGGKPADLAVGKTIEVKGDLSPDGSEVIATRIKFEHK
jgi:hypothetical protein